MKRRWKKLSLHRILGLCMVSVLLLAESCFSTPFKSRKTTVFGTVTDFDTKLPVDSIQIMIVGNNGVIASKGDELKVVYTDKQGNYSVTIDVPNGYHSLSALNRYFDKISYVFKYRDYILYKNNTRTNDCCRVDIGSKTQYDFVMLPK